MNRAPRTHLLIRGKRVACKITDFTRFTRNLRMVTCQGCMGSPHMADAEVRQNANPNNRT